MQQRAAIARALIHDPKLILMDEPFGALDALTREKMNLELLRIWEEAKKTIVFVTHGITEAVFLGTRVIVLTAGPARMADNFRVELPHPRTLEMKTSEQFGEYTRRIYRIAWGSRKDARSRRRNARQEEAKNGAATSRHHHERRHRPHGHEPASDPLDRGDPRPGRRGAAQRRHASCPIRSWSAATRASSRNWRRRTASTRWTTDLNAALKNPDDTLFFDAATTKLRAKLLHKAIAAGKDIYCEKPTAENLKDAARRRARRQEGGHQARRGAGQAVPARPAQAQDADRLRLFRPHPLGARRVRLLGVRGRLAAGAAAVVELPQEGRRRHHPRYALPLALRARQPVRRGARASPASAQPIFPSAGTRTTSPTRPTSTTPPMRRSSSRAASSRRSTAPGARACAATISSPSMSTARWARRSPACRNAGARRG